MIIPEGQRTVYFLKQTVRKLFSVFKKTEAFISTKHPELGTTWLPEDIHFITTQEVKDTYPKLRPKERENEIAKRHNAVFIMQIGDVLKSGLKHAMDALPIMTTGS